ncbi:DUF5996 family protein [Pontibacter arcticus]|uniref:Ava_C0101 and related proteins n=1 Tax=Pontibacter arcticus TaxID=2080288 RepID=A0A364RDV3_9BACT|nr:DUF5996 family protein [Pontibacter arcticus]RAU82459.1 hypothetical protein DP923_11790 [Pontibacter arcticus]
MQNTWPALSYADAKATYETLHLWTQIIGKIKLAKLPWLNHSWHVTLLVTPTGLTTSTLPAGKGYFQVDFDLVSHQLNITTSTGKSHTFVLESMAVADFYHKVISALQELGIEVSLNTMPNELEHPIPFEEDYTHATYHPKQVENLHKALLLAQDVMQQFRVKFTGKCSPVHFFWGSFDLAVSRFSGKTAPAHPGGVPNLPDWVAQEAYSHEVCSCGFWPGSEAVPFAAFYTYIYPEPEGYKTAAVKPEAAYYHTALGEFILPYEAVQNSENPTAILSDFLQSTYETAANLAKWDRKALEKQPVAE